MKNIFINGNRADPLYEDLAQDLVFMIHPGSIKLIGKLRP